MKSRDSQRLQKDPHFYMGATTPSGEKNMVSRDSIVHRPVG